MKKLLLLLSFIFAIFIRIDSSWAGDCGIPDLDTSINGTAYGYTRLNGDAGYNESTYGLTQGSGEWAVQFSYGVVYGIANCNTISGTSLVAAEITPESEGEYCWCKATGFTPTSSSYTSGPQCVVSPVSSSWVLTGPSSVCMGNCALACAARLLFYSEDRSVVFGAVSRPSVNLTWDGSSSTTPTSCTLGSTFVPPTPEPRPGYIFTGWKVRVLEKCGIDQLDTSINISEEYWDKCVYKNPYGECPECGDDRLYPSDYGITANDTWAAEAPYGTIWGRSKCSATSGDDHNDEWGAPSSDWLKTPSETNGQYCWCQVTGFSPSGSNYTQGPQCTTTASNLWVCHYDAGSIKTCEDYCARDCADYIQLSEEFREAIYGAVGQ